ncbi:MAG: hypothetical protein JWQ09_5827 [Segetibacter sp.]|nr:hypothetical protein [Segetibacter sp.]
MKTFTEQLEDLKNEAQKVVLSHFKDGELHFSERTLTLEDGGWREDSYIDKDDLYKLSAEFVCDLADELV